MYICIYIYVYICIYICIYTHTHIYIHTYATKFQCGHFYLKYTLILRIYTDYKVIFHVALTSRGSPFIGVP